MEIYLNVDWICWYHWVALWYVAAIPIIRFGNLDIVDENNHRMPRVILWIFSPILLPIIFLNFLLGSK